MNSDKVRAHVRQLAVGLAWESFVVEHPDASDGAAAAYAERHWREYVELTLEFLSYKVAGKDVLAN